MRNAQHLNYELLMGKNNVAIVENRCSVARVENYWLGILAQTMSSFTVMNLYKTNLQYILLEFTA